MQRDEEIEQHTWPDSGNSPAVIDCLDRGLHQLKLETATFDKRVYHILAAHNYLRQINYTDLLHHYPNLNILDVLGNDNFDCSIVPPQRLKVVAACVRTNQPPFITINGEGLEYRSVDSTRTALQVAGANMVVILLGVKFAVEKKIGYDTPDSLDIKPLHAPLHGIHYHMRNYTDRFASFCLWPGKKVYDPNGLARAGFFLDEQHVKCPMCRVKDGWLHVPTGSRKMTDSSNLAEKNFGSFKSELITGLCSNASARSIHSCTTILTTKRAVALFKYIFAYLIRHAYIREVKMGCQKCVTGTESIAVDKRLRMRFQQYMRQKDIEHFSTLGSETKAATVERFHRTIMERLYRYFSLVGNKRYVEVLQSFVDPYNETPHKTLGFVAPNNVTENNKEEIKKALYGTHKVTYAFRRLSKEKFVTEQLVRVSV
ncbi:hypothetical protein RvY_01868 [Ramazzottius varieornatus]|uniref:Integrase catalytic domain-containing protein n=1 Tax=Ramazzottius varieornatus TaxID=947166 RepID=A0A1D1UNT3_RAMVA|nr:hypothetical protein RvY_01868 [Ramazzottius varieornatus]